MLICHISALFLLCYVHACTNLIVTAGASENKRNMVAYSADAQWLYGSLFFSPAADHEEGEMHKIIEFETGKDLGEIPEVSHTYNVIGNMNEWGLSIAESTWFCQNELSGEDIDTFIMDYYSLLRIALQRCKTAREAIDTIVTLCDTYGYHSIGESFTIADANEIWLMDFVGRGTLYKEDVDESKIVYVAQKLQDGHICAHANQARTTTFSLSGEANDSLLYTKDIKEFALRVGNVKEVGDELDFSAAFNPLKFMNVRNGDGRVWSFFNKVGVEGMKDFENYALGKDLSKRMDLSYPLPEGKTISLSYLQDCLGLHYEDTILNMTSDVGAGPWGWSNRWYPILFTATPQGGKEGKYIHERPIGIPEAMWTFIAVMPPPETKEEDAKYEASFYFCPNDGTYSIYTPFYPCITDIPYGFGEDHISPSGHPVRFDLNHFSFDSMYWLTNVLANFAYQNTVVIGKEIKEKRDDLQGHLAEAKEQADEEIKRLREEGKEEEAVDYATRVCLQWGDTTREEMKALFQHLFVKYSDLVKKNWGAMRGEKKAEEMGYPQEWYDRIVKYAQKEAERSASEELATEL